MGPSGSLLHCTLYVFMSLCLRKPASYKADFQQLRQQASLIPWELGETLDLPEAYSFFQQRISKFVNDLVPKSKAGRSRNLYMNKTALWLKKAKRSCWAQYLRTSSPLGYASYAKTRNQLMKMTRQLRRKFEAKLADELNSNPKAFSHYANTRMKTKIGIDALVDETGVTHSSPQIKADILNRFFSGTFVKEDLSFVPAPEQWFFDDKLTDAFITPAEC